ncbi:MAG: amino acid ABC transporter permease [Desulfobulbaceae bacterium]|nr:amino acid ABC transporter permease [Desulfobulbaceae bacterium]
MDNLQTKKGDLLKFVPKPDRVPVTITYGPIGWLKKNMFGNIWNTLLTVAVFSLLFLLLKPFLEWTVFKAVWSASTRRECLAISPDGACWAGIIPWVNNLTYGLYPDNLQWRVNLGFGLGLLWFMPLALKKVQGKMTLGLMGVLLFPFLANYLFLGGDRSALHYTLGCAALAYLLLIYVNIVLSYLQGKRLEHYIEPIFDGFAPKRPRLWAHLMSWLLVTLATTFIFRNLTLEHVAVDVWGGFFLTLIISGVSIVMALPIGIILALGRRSEMPIIKWFSICTIELVRSVPMITVLFMSVTMLPLFFPNTMELNKLVQVLVAVCLFAGAYMAETVRGGLQAIPRGQFDAAKSIGLKYWYTMAFIILPQALKAMIPNIVTSFISLFKDTTLVSIIGLFDIMLMARNIAIDKNWLGLHTEPLVAISILFFVFCYAMSQYSQRLEKRLNTNR